ncbi:LPXTG-motif cell wall-anchored protein [Evansella vedderi]|uniref:LPXTG-motif cell wall-anchored protein n=1 Tax=Evansella vedderi TaxID=38282 RepID=A0ABT9ZZX0_9BACI|nr:LamG-like jellyroll fold domain-containing protein [Evansella vedderi]MDQ0256787.1 LPXTG-motif cell wall-anchored protein [Evansella vedderi]
MKKTLKKITIILLALTLFFPHFLYGKNTSVNPVSAAENNSLVAQYLFAENVNDSSGNNLHGSIGGDIAYIVDPEIGPAINLNGTGYVEIPADIVNQTDMTISSWVYWEGEQNWSRIFDFFTPDHPDGSMFLTPSTHYEDIQMNIGKYGVGLNEVISSESFPIQEWAHIAITIDNNLAKIYLNGEVVAIDENLGLSPNEIEATKAYLGKSMHDHADPLLNGKLAQFEIHSRSLSAQEIAEKAGKTQNVHDIVFPEAPAPSKDDFPQLDEPNFANEDKWTTWNTHDAEIIKVDDTYYVFSTDYAVGQAPSAGIQIRESQDLINWEFTGRVFDSVTEEASEWTNGADIFWAPDVVKMNDKFYLYYAVSEFGTRNSYIGLATSDNIEGPWVDQGAVVKTRAGDGHSVNAIDPGIVIDADGTPWMVYGSYFGGIYITELDSDTGKRVNEEDMGTLIASRQDQGIPHPGPAIEGPAIMYNADTGYYYLFVTYGWLEDTYNVRVARSKNVEGPYLDFNGNDMVDPSGSSETGTKIINSYAFEGDAGWLGTGHNGLLQDGDNHFIIHNARAGENLFWSHLHVRKLLWTEDGWPVVSPQRYAGEYVQEVSEEHVVGIFEQIVLPRDNDSQITPNYITLLPGGDINYENSNSYWELSSENILTLNWYDPNNAPDGYWIDTLTVIPSWDWENWEPTMVFTGLNQFGTAIWGKNVGDMTDEERVAFAKEQLNLNNIDSITSNLSLPTMGQRDTSISWESSNPEFITNEGIVTRPPHGSGNVDLTLTATISRGSASDTKDFEATVLELGSPEIANYSFDKDNGNQILDSSGNDLHGTIHGGVSWVEEGKVGGAIQLNGADGYIQVPNTVSDAEDFTFTAWVNWSGGGIWQRIFDFGGSGGWMFLTPSTHNDELFFTIYHNNEDQTLATDQLPEDEWIHVAITIEGNTGKLYINGELKDVNQNMTHLPKQINADSNYLGNSRFDSDPTFNGMLDEVEILRYALTEEEITERVTANEEDTEDPNAADPNIPDPDTSESNDPANDNKSDEQTNDTNKVEDENATAVVDSGDSKDNKDSTDSVTDTKEKTDEKSGSNETKEGEELPNTYTNIYNFLLLGLILVLIGTAYFVIRRRFNRSLT